MVHGHKLNLLLPAAPVSVTLGGFGRHCLIQEASITALLLPLAVPPPSAELAARHSLGGAVVRPGAPGAAGSAGQLLDWLRLLTPGSADAAAAAAGAAAAAEGGGGAQAQMQVRASAPPK